jgi:hypothetical protein
MKDKLNGIERKCRKQDTTGAINLYRKVHNITYNRDSVGKTDEDYCINSELKDIRRKDRIELLKTKFEKLNTENPEYERQIFNPKKLTSLVTPELETINSFNQLSIHMSKDTIYTFIHPPTLYNIEETKLFNPLNISTSVVPPKNQSDNMQYNSPNVFFNFDIQTETKQYTIAENLLISYIYILKSGFALTTDDIKILNTEPNLTDITNAGGRKKYRKTRNRKHKKSIQRSSRHNRKHRTIRRKT